MHDDHKVQVFSFRFIEHPLENFHLAGYKATREAIESVGGELLPGTRQEVPLSEVDALGHYRRINSGWADLD
jgi:hypothetical protein